eukprot:8264843-Prorocentrum_lima.AAC.1
MRYLFDNPTAVLQNDSGRVLQVPLDNLLTSPLFPSSGNLGNLSHLRPASREKEGPGLGLFPRPLWPPQPSHPLPVPASPAPASPFPLLSTPAMGSDVQHSPVGTSVAGEQPAQQSPPVASEILPPPADTSATGELQPQSQGPLFMP